MKANVITLISMGFLLFSCSEDSIPSALLISDNSEIVQNQHMDLNLITENQKVNYDQTIVEEVPAVNNKSEISETVFEQESGIVAKLQNKSVGETTVQEESNFNNNHHIVEVVKEIVLEQENKTNEADIVEDN